MPQELRIALNHITAPRLNCRDFIDLAARIGCVGIELRNDLADKRLTGAEFFDGEAPARIGAYAKSRNVRLLGLSEIYGFNRWSADMRSKVATLIEQAKGSGAESISLIPSNDGADEPAAVRQDHLHNALSEILPMLAAADLIALIEPLGFETSSLRHKGEAVAAIEAVGGRGRFKLVHDTFHHFIAGETEFFPEYTGIVHISGVVETVISRQEMRDGHRILVTSGDRLENCSQIETLENSGYRGAYSFEAFAKSVQSSQGIEGDLRQSIDAIRAGLKSRA